MVDPAPLAWDIVGNTVSVALPGIAWGLLFLLAWLRPRFAESVGLGRREFWLLLPGSLAASFAVLPFLPVAQDVVAVSFSGAVFPLLVAALAIGRLAPPLRRSLGIVVGGLALTSGALLLPVLLVTWGDAGRLAAVLHTDGAGAADLLVALLTLVFSVGLLAALGFGRGERERRLLSVLLASLAVELLTFLGSSAIAGVGIVESFPYFLLPPAFAGMVVAGAARGLFPGEEGFALPVAFFAGSWGTALGADLLRQPGLYGPGPAGLYVIGGAGVLDLVYLSGFVALGGALLVHLFAGRPFAPVGAPLAAPRPSPLSRLRAAYDLGLAGDTRGSLRASAEAANLAAEHARTLRGVVGPPPAGHPWEGLPVPGWVVSDQANLEGMARSENAEPAESLRGWLTARWIVRWSAELSRESYATLRQRILAFLVDLAVVLGGSAAILAVPALALPGSLDELLGGIGYNTAIYACLTGTFLYFVLCELRGGATVGKRVWHLEVRDRSNRPVGGLAALVRNVSLLPSLTLAVLGIAIAVAILAKGFSAVTVGGIGVPAGLLALLGVGVFVGGGLLVFGAVGILAISLSFERQRVGDAWAGTWVVRALSGPAPAPRPVPAQGPGPVPPA